MLSFLPWQVLPQEMLAGKTDQIPIKRQRNYFILPTQGGLSVSCLGTCQDLVGVLRDYAPTNTGVASGFDLNNNGQTVTTPGAPGYGDDALGFDAFERQFGMVLFSKYPIDTANVRIVRNFLWKDMPGALLPDDPNIATPNDWYSPHELEVVRLSSKSHWDVPVIVDGEVVRVLAVLPSPPVFDGPEDRNQCRNRDEIRLWADYVTPGKGEYLYDDQVCPSCSLARSSRIASSIGMTMSDNSAIGLFWRFGPRRASPPAPLRP